MSHLCDPDVWSYLEEGTKVTFTVAKKEDDQFFADGVEVLETVERE
jgi:hypothetical protein